MSIQATVLRRSLKKQFSLNAHPYHSDSWWSSLYLYVCHVLGWLSPDPLWQRALSKQTGALQGVRYLAQNTGENTHLPIRKSHSATHPSPSASPSLCHAAACGLTRAPWLCFCLSFGAHIHIQWWARIMVTAQKQKNNSIHMQRQVSSGQCPAV